MKFSPQVRLQPRFLGDDTFNKFLYVTIDLLLEVYWLLLLSNRLFFIPSFNLLITSLSTVGIVFTKFPLEWGLNPTCIYQLVKLF